MPDVENSEKLPEQHGRVWRRAVILAFLCIVLAALAASETLHAALIQVLEICEDTIAHAPALGAVLFVAFAAVSAMLAFVSTAVVVPVAVVAWGVPLSILLLWLGWTLGGVCSYAIGRYLGRPAVRWLVAEATLHRLESRIQRSASFGLVLLLQLGLPSEIPGYVLGLARYRFPRYLLAFALAEIPYTVATVYVGAGFVERRSGLVLAVGMTIVAFSVAAFYVLRKKLYRAEATR